MFTFQFTKISYGYSWANVSHVAHQYGAVLRSLPAQPGEGTIPLKHAKNMLNYLLSNAGKLKDRRESVNHLLIIYDTLLKHPDAFLDEEVSIIRIYLISYKLYVGLMFIYNFRKYTIFKML